ncbi:hypothetical protein EUX98_g3657 [Antrodiella citrinella]|uniref:Uncharacterized protein n=1 Tax=Antrodiella citrinella TaxID=2447956 RepID=A0A4S4MY23_9APHY|nr:hypothetical protein EUX98_g3657 [Antrodiella citrinella]
MQVQPHDSRRSTYDATYESWSICRIDTHPSVMDDFSCWATDLFSVFDEYDDVVGWQVDTPSRLASLPPELLVEIFLDVMRAEEEERTHFKMNYSQAVWHALKHFMCVCCYWRTVALHAPILWRDIQFGDMSRGVTEKMLQRSGRTPLHLTVLYKDADSKQQTDTFHSERVESELYRTSHLHARILHLWNKQPPKGSFDAPLLQELRIEALVYTTTFTNIPLISPHFPLPLLRSIQTSGIQFRDISPFFRPTLRQLRVLLSPARTSPSVAEFLHALSGTPHLEELLINNVFASYGPDQFSLGLPQVNLPCLKSFQMEDDTVASMVILQHITFPASVLLSRQFTATGTYSTIPGSAGNLLEAVLSKFVGHGIIGDLPVISTVTLINHGPAYWNHHAADIELWYDGEGEGPGDASVPFFRHHFESMLLPIHQLFWKAAPRPFLAGIRTLTITSERHDHCRSDSFLGPALSGLESLHLGNTLGLMMQLAGAYAPGAAVSSAITPDLLPFPNLRELTLSHAGFRNLPKDHPHDPFLTPSADYELLTPLLVMVKVRCEAGRPLRRIGVYEAVRFTEDDVQLLQEYVDEVDWDGKVLCNATGSSAFH